MLEFTFGSYVLKINIRSRMDLMQAVEQRLKNETGFALATVNLDHLVKLAHSAAFRTAYGHQDLVVADGFPIVWFSKLAGRPVDLIPGSDLVVPLCELAARSGVAVSLVGSTDEVLKKAADVLRAQIPGLSIDQLIAPPFGFDPNGPHAEEILNRLNTSKTRICFVAMGAPKQEAFAARGRELAPKVGFTSIGAGLDFLARKQNRAPEWMRRMSLEWLWRLATNPTRLSGRYLKCAAVVPGHVIKALALRVRQKSQ